MTTNANNLVSDETVRAFRSQLPPDVSRILGDYYIRIALEAIAPMLAQAGDDIEDQRDALEDCVFISYRLLGGKLQRSQIANIRDELPEMIRTAVCKAQAGDAVSESAACRCGALCQDNGDVCRYTTPPHNDGKVARDAIESIQRYEIRSAGDIYGGSCFFEEKDSEGDWVKWSDLDTAIKEQRALYRPTSSHGDDGDKQP